MRFFVGGYTADKGGEADGIGVLHAGAADDVLAGGQLSYARVVATDGSPSWLAWHPTLPVLYAAMAAAGTVRAFLRAGEASFLPLGGAVAAGSAVCHIAVSPDGGWLVASCYDDGRVVRIDLDGRGALGRTVTAEAAHDPYGRSGEPSFALAAAPEYPPRERSAMDALVALLSERNTVPAPAVASDGARPSHAHEASFTPSGLVSVDLGLDQVRVWDARGGRLRERARVVLPQGAGPRHCVWHPSGHLFVVTEHSAEVFVVRPEQDGAWSLVGGAPLIGTTPGSDFPAEIALTRDARFVLVGVRGSDTIATLRVGGDGNALATTALVESGVEWPRHHVIARHTLLVAGERSHEIASLAIDERTGIPGRVRHRVTAPSPTQLLADR
ncbi:beta-propeller fold lactonase family protein [uncultured Microbacterium sp.]|uniref:lactonase family protein n=1 Tax=uncultured Microbacterium sp. TaxID=191216 RepID=UPI00261B4C6F|nr:beta-propeller fold lactonase family protein [uncultured Microbacterium sp.]